MSENEDLKKAEEELSSFLETHPEMKKFQKEIDESMKNIENPELRLFTLMSKIIENNNRLIDIMSKVIEERR